MNKKKAFILLIILTIIGSVICYYATNLILADVINYSYGWNGLNILASIPGVMFAVDTVCATVFVIRYYKNNKNKKRTLSLYIKLMIIFSIIGILGSIAASTFSYDSITVSYPFPYYLIISIVLHAIIIIILTIISSKVLKNMEEDEEKKKISFGYFLYSVFLPCFVFYSYNRLGAVLLSFTYIQTSTIHMTWSLFVWLLIPIMILYYIISAEFDVYQSISIQVIQLLAFGLLNLSLGASYYITSSHNSLYISSISPAFGLDRMLAFPLIAIFHFVVCTLLIIICLFRLIKIRPEHHNNIDDGHKDKHEKRKEKHKHHRVKREHHIGFRSRRWGNTV